MPGDLHAGPVRPDNPGLMMLAGRGFQGSVAHLIREDGRLIAGLVLVQFIVYSYFFSTLIFTNHTFPNTEVFPYPSFKTLEEGRWMADLIIWLQGGSGVQPFQMFVAVTVQAVNGVLFARFAGLERFADRALVAAMMCLYPAFLDGYSYAIDHITFAVGDTLAIVAMMLAAERTQSFRTAAMSSALLAMSLACYQPKIALIGLLALIWLVRQMTSERSGPAGFRESAATVTYLGLMVAGGSALYYMSTLVTVTNDSGVRMHVNSAPAMAAQAAAAYRKLFESPFASTYLPGWLGVLPWICVAVGGGAVVMRAWRRRAVAGVVALAGLLLIPLALQAPYILNDRAWESVGRITYPSGYALAFFAACALLVQAFRRIAVGIVSVVLYFFLVIGTQEANAAALKTLYDVNTINRIVARVESAAGNFDGPPRPIVVFGNYPEFNVGAFVRQPDASQANFHTNAFATFRHAEILNAFIGRAVFESPTRQQVDKAVAEVVTREPWPSGESVFALDRTIVVLLEKYRPDMDHTWARGQVDR